MYVLISPAVQGRGRCSHRITGCTFGAGGGAVAAAAVVMTPAAAPPPQGPRVGLLRQWHLAVAECSADALLRQQCAQVCTGGVDSP
jgi:hypothetical protein